MPSGWTLARPPRLRDVVEHRHAVARRRGDDVAGLGVDERAEDRDEEAALEVGREQAVELEQEVARLGVARHGGARERARHREHDRGRDAAARRRHHEDEDAAVLELVHVEEVRRERARETVVRLEQEPGPPRELLGEEPLLDLVRDLHLVVLLDEVAPHQLGGGEVARHAVERRREHADLVRRLRRRAVPEVALRDGLDVLEEVLERPGDHAAPRAMPTAAQATTPQSTNTMIHQRSWASWSSSQRSEKTTVAVPTSWPLRFTIGLVKARAGSRRGDAVV